MVAFIIGYEVKIMRQIYLLDADVATKQLITWHLEKEGYLVTAFEVADDLWLDFMENKLNVDALILDIIVSGSMDGLELCQKIRTISEMPIIFVSEKADVADRIIGLESGADDYLTKPFDPRELVVRLNTLMRRAGAVGQSSGSGEEKYQVGDIEIDAAKRACLVGGKEVTLTNNEYLLLTFLIKNKNISFMRKELIQKIWGYDYVGESRMIDDLVKRLRKKLKIVESQVEIITVWGYGYRLDEGE